MYLIAAKTLLLMCFHPVCGKKLPNDFKNAEFPSTSQWPYRKHGGVLLCEGWRRMRVLPRDPAKELEEVLF